MFFGLTNSPTTFQTMMDDIFEDLISEGVVVVYLDDPRGAPEGHLPHSGASGET